jgi:hypothetical protein
MAIERGAIRARMAEFMTVILTAGYPTGDHPRPRPGSVPACRVHCRIREFGENRGFLPPDASVPDAS